MKPRPNRSLLAVAAAVVATTFAGAASAAQDAAPPEAQAWIDIATVSGIGMPMAGMAGNPAAALGGLFGGKSGGNNFGNSHGMAAGRWVDVTIKARANPNLDEAQLAVPERFLSPALRLKAATNAAPAPLRDDEEIKHEEPEKPKGRMLLYWGCGNEIRPGQPKEFDMASASIADYGKFFSARSATQRGAHSAVGRPVWPNPDDARMVPPQASLVGEHAFSGKGIPEGFRFSLPPAQDLMPPLTLEQADKKGATSLSWNAIATARGYFVSAMGVGGKEDMVMWTSSELPDTGFGLMDYQTNAAVDRWLKEKVLLPRTTTVCSVPAGVFGEHGAMLRLIAYGDELNLAQPPRPRDPKLKWEPLWAVKLRVKSVANAILGMPGQDLAAGAEQNRNARREGNRERAGEASEAPKMPQPIELLKGIFGR